MVSHGPVLTHARRSVRAHEAILEAAVAVVGQHGYIGATIEAIAATAGTGKQTIYRWWPNKSALFLEVYAALANEAELTVNTGSVRDDLQAMLSRLFGVYARTEAAIILAGLISEAQSKTDVADALYVSLVERRRHLLGEILSRGAERGELASDADIDLAVDMISGIIWFRLLLHRDPLDARFAGRIADFILRGLSA